MQAPKLNKVYNLIQQDMELSTTFVDFAVTETRFRKLYLSMLAKEIGRSFHAYDMTDRYAIAEHERLLSKK